MIFVSENVISMIKIKGFWILLIFSNLMILRNVMGKFFIVGVWERSELKCWSLFFVFLIFIKGLSLVCIVVIVGVRFVVCSVLFVKVLCFSVLFVMWLCGDCLIFVWFVGMVVILVIWWSGFGFRRCVLLGVGVIVCLKVFFEFIEVGYCLKF